MDICLIIDVSWSMIGKPLQKAKEASKSLVTNMIDLNTHRVGIVEFGGYAKKLSDLTNDKEVLSKAIKKMVCFGSTDMAGGLRKCRKSIFDKAENKKVVILVTDGDPDDEDLALIQSEKLKKDTKVIAIGIGSEVNKHFLKKIVSSSSDYYSGKNFGELISIFETISTSLKEI